MEDRWSEQLLDAAAKLPEPWCTCVEEFLCGELGYRLMAAIDAEVAAGVQVFPPVHQIFRALQETPWDRVCVVAVGQDPYHQAGQADGMAFSVGQGTRWPPSLRNIATEVLRGAREQASPQAQQIALHPEQTQLNLAAWAKQGVLLLNSSLSVRASQAASHSSLGWQVLTTRLLELLAQRPGPMVYWLWGAHAQKMWPEIAPIVANSQQAHLCLKSNHPSPLSAYKPPIPFVGNGHFVQAQAWLAQHGVVFDALQIFEKI